MRRKYYFPLSLVLASTTLPPFCSFSAQIGAEIAAIIMESQAFDYLDAPVERITGADVPMPYTQTLERLALPQVEDITRAVRRTLAAKK